jgi:hypothetical protein
MTWSCSLKDWTSFAKLRDCQDLKRSCSTEKGEQGEETKEVPMCLPIDKEVIARRLQTGMDRTVNSLHSGITILHLIRSTAATIVRVECQQAAEDQREEFQEVLSIQRTVAPGSITIHRKRV